MWKIELDRKQCLGAGVCVGTAPELFALEGGRSYPLRTEIEPNEDAAEAAESCPAMAITIWSGAEVVAPEP
ncbi:ferredoxin [Streptomyces sp. TP-A0874]|uniref:ferredoxin n=1 Tax=Streptomyces sp. TP-A0874 TaxID=549819 RepID=UPI000852EE60|nr:ferredoxin [Streptomyces sp. TP-A0874]